MAYTPKQRAEALAVLEANNGNMLRTSQELGIGQATLKTWVTESRDEKNTYAQETLEHLPEAKTNLLDKLDNAINQTLTQYVGSIADLKAKDAAVALAVLIDKAQLLRGGATARTEQIITEGVTIESEIKRLSQELKSNANRPTVDAME